ncbi:MAG: peptide chain release factor N(5)-glutamine methyltransferase [Chitinophagaceae bacterium]
MTIQAAYQWLLQQLFERYDTREAANIANWLMEEATGFTKIDRIINKDFKLSVEQQTTITSWGEALTKGQPVQYVLGYCYWGNMQLKVNAHVLIPRPETEELAAWIVKSVANDTPLSIADIGTGSGCIPIYLKKHLPQGEVYAIDVDANALQVAQANAIAQQTTIHFKQLDALRANEWQVLPPLDVLVSNPPYVLLSEAETMMPHVLDHEPHLALFVPDTNPLLFYQAIATQGLQYLKQDGWLFFEINEQYAAATVVLLEKLGYTNIVVQQDMQGKDRMLRARK